MSKAKTDAAEREAQRRLASMLDAIMAESNALGELLFAKNRSYGNSAFDPIRIFSRVSWEEAIRVRIDDKLSRIARGGDYDAEDTIVDLAGYLILLRAGIRLRAAGLLP